ncbi:MAG: endonuclease III [Chromatiales bacterium]|jgi:endonuclease-3|nr:endonuclease III [Chromatiales bacterium]
MNAAKRRAIFARLHDLDPEPKGELNYNSSFQLLIAVILSAQATDKSVNKATAPLFAIAPDALAMRKLGEEGLAHYIRSIGLYRSKARNVIATCQQLIEHYDGNVPRDRAALEALPGVGRKTANVVLNIAFGEPVIAVDTHVFRISNRTGIAPGRNVKEVEEHLAKVVPQEFMLHAHHWLILHGRYVCLARRPRCPDCAIADLCEYEHKTPVAENTAAATPIAPITKKRATSNKAGKHAVRTR